MLRESLVKFILFYISFVSTTFCYSFEILFIPRLELRSLARSLSFNFLLLHFVSSSTRFPCHSKCRCPICERVLKQISSFADINLFCCDALIYSVQFFLLFFRHYLFHIIYYVHYNVIFQLPLVSLGWARPWPKQKIRILSQQNDKTYGKRERTMWHLYFHERYNFNENEEKLISANFTHTALRSNNIIHQIGRLKKPLITQH